MWLEASEQAPRSAPGGAALLPGGQAAPRPAKRTQLLRQPAPAPLEPREPSAPAPAPQRPQDWADRPVGLATLTPRSDLLGAGEPEVAPRGRTLHPGELPTREEQLADEAARVAERTEGWMRDTLAQRRVAVGTVDPYLTDLRRALVRQLDDPPNFTEPKTLEALGTTLARSYLASAEQYGASGSPVETPPPTRVAEAAAPSALEAAVEKGSHQARELQGLLRAGAGLRDFADGRLGVQLYAVVEIRQEPSGAIEAMTLLQPSGVPTFDLWVMSRARLATEVLGQRDGGLRPLLSHWGFTGRVSYKRRVRDLRLKDDWWYLAVAGASSLMTGTFDEVSGKVDYVDLRHPHYECGVKLLAEY